MREGKRRRFDLPDRLFHSVAESWESASGDGNLSDVRELTPEFYCLPDFLVRPVVGVAADARVGLGPVSFGCAGSCDFDWCWVAQGSSCHSRNPIRNGRRGFHAWASPHQDHTRAMIGMLCGGLAEYSHPGTFPALEPPACLTRRAQGRAVATSIAAR
jgi:hypothetical protein